VPLNIKNPEVERLVNEVAELTGETKTQAVRRALEERKARLCLRVTESSRAERLERFFETEVWPIVPNLDARWPLSEEEEDRILGYGPEGA